MAKGKKKNKKARQTWIRRIDLHGMRVDEAIAELDRFLNICLLDEDVHQVEIIHGIGSGKVKTAVLLYLKELNVIRAYRADLRNPGATWVEL